MAYGRATGAAAASQKLTEEDVRFIKGAILLERRMRPPGRRYAAYGFRVRLARKFGVSVELIREIAARRKHKHVKVRVKRGSLCPIK